jgi:CheY-like chemotaxis protein
MIETQPGKDILIVEDDDLSREVLEVLLQSTGYRIRSSPSGDDALRTLSYPFPDVILTDLQMPGTMGNDLADQMRALCPPTTRLLAMSGTEVSDASVDRYDGFLLKPFSNQDLDRLLQGEGPQPEETHQGEQGPTEAQLPVLDPDVYAALERSMPATQLSALYQLCVRDARRRIERMREHLQAGDDVMYRREAHAIKGGCGMLGALEMRDLAALMETDGIQPGNGDCESELLSQFLTASERLERMLKAPEHDNPLG